MTKFLFLAQGYVWVEEKKEKKSMCQTGKYIAPRRGGGGPILWRRSSRNSTTPCNYLKLFCENLSTVLEKIRDTAWIFSCVFSCVVIRRDFIIVDQCVKV